MTTDFFTLTYDQAQVLLKEKGDLKFWQLAALETFQSPPPNPLANLLILELLEKAIQGSACIHLSKWLLNFLTPRLLASDKSVELEELLLAWIGEEPCLKYEKPWLYLKSYWDLEERIAQRLRYFSTLKTSLESPSIEDYDFLKKLNPEQRQAALASLKTPFLMVAGGPGTGKTFTAASICEVLKQALAHKKNQDSSLIRMALLAPTGKAAIRLQESIKQASNTSKDTWIESMTLHAYLAKGMKEGGYHFLSNPAPYDLILIDEASMIDPVHFDELFKTIHESTHLIMMGDPDQLPPVEGPGLFSAMVQAFFNPNQKSLNCVYLKRPVRAQNQALVQAASSIRLGDQASWHQLIASAQEVKSHRVELAKESSQAINKPTNDASLKAKIDEILLPSFLQARDQAFQPLDKGLESLSKEMILCVSRSGVWGTGAINEKLFQKLRAEALQENWSFLNIPVMATVNQPAIQRMNGQMGFLRISLNELERLATLDQVLSKSKQVYFQSSFEGVVSIPCIRLEKMQPAWAITVHKSQGSEFESVQLLLTEKALLFGRTLLYTACTRAKKKLVLWSYGDTLDELFTFQTSDLTGMSQRLLKESL